MTPNGALKITKQNILILNAWQIDVPGLSTYKSGRGGRGIFVFSSFKLQDDLGNILKITKQTFSS